MNTETQKCNHCKAEKFLSEFHRRGAGFQRICKECRKTKRQTASNARAPHIINTENFPVLSERIAAIDAMLHSKASRFATDNIEADDVYSAMVEAILTKSVPSDSNARLLRRANWVATQYIQNKLAYNFNVDSEGDDEIDSSYPSSMTVEDEVVQIEVSDQLKAIIAQLPAEYQQVVSLLALGMNQREIAKKLNVSPQAVNEKIGKIGNKMLAFGLSL